MAYLPEHIHISAPATYAPGVQETPMHELKRSQITSQGAYPPLKGLSAPL